MLYNVLMRILLTNNHLAHFGGTETAVLTLARELIRRGHDVGIYTHNQGVITDLLAGHLDENPQDYDLALINHNTCAHVSARKRIYTCHGLYDAIEVPPLGMDAYVAVSENISKKYNIPLIIKNPIDTEQFKPTSSIGTKPERILSITEDDIPVPHFKPSRYEETMPELMNRADLVVTIGRGVLEAMSCARNVIVYDKRPNMGFKADGYLEDFSHLHGNVGGEYHLSSIDIAHELTKYNQEHGERNREYVLKHHDVRNIVDKYLSL